MDDFEPGPETGLLPSHARRHMAFSPHTGAMLAAKVLEEDTDMSDGARSQSPHKVSYGEDKGLNLYSEERPLTPLLSSKRGLDFESVASSSAGAATAAAATTMTTMTKMTTAAMTTHSEVGEFPFESGPSPMVVSALRVNDNNNNNNNDDDDDDGDDTDGDEDKRPVVISNTEVQLDSQPGLEEAADDSEIPRDDSSVTNSFYFLNLAPGEAPAPDQWSEEEERIFIGLILAEPNPPFVQWGLFARSLPGRTGRQCRFHYHNLLSRGKITNVYLCDRRGVYVAKPAKTPSWSSRYSRTVLSPLGAAAAAKAKDDSLGSPTPRKPLTSSQATASPALGTARAIGPSSSTLSSPSSAPSTVSGGQGGKITTGLGVGVGGSRPTPSSSSSSSLAFSSGGLHSPSASFYPSQSSAALLIGARNRGKGASAISSRELKDLQAAYIATLPKARFRVKPSVVASLKGNGSSGQGGDSDGLPSSTVTTTTTTTSTAMSSSSNGSSSSGGGGSASSSTSHLSSLSSLSSSPLSASSSSLTTLHHQHSSSSSSVSTSSSSSGSSSGLSDAPSPGILYGGGEHGERSTSALPPRLISFLQGPVKLIRTQESATTLEPVSTTHLNDEEKAVFLRQDRERRLKIQAIEREQDHLKHTVEHMLTRAFAPRSGSLFTLLDGCAELASPRSLTYQGLLGDRGSGDGGSGSSELGVVSGGGLAAARKVLSVTDTVTQMKSDLILRQQHEVDALVCLQTWEAQGILSRAVAGGATRPLPVPRMTVVFPYAYPPAVRAIIES